VINDAANSGNVRSPLGSAEVERVKTHRVSRASRARRAPALGRRHAVSVDVDRHVYPPIGSDQIPRCDARVILCGQARSACWSPCVNHCIGGSRPYRGGWCVGSGRFHGGGGLIGFLGSSPPREPCPHLMVDVYIFME
jgi:hypothetical protein